MGEVLVWNTERISIQSNRAEEHHEPFHAYCLCAYISFL